MRITGQSLCLTTLHGGLGRVRLLLLLALTETKALSERWATERRCGQRLREAVGQDRKKRLGAGCRGTCPSTSCWEQCTPQLECHRKPTEAIDRKTWLMIWPMDCLMEWPSERGHVQCTRLVFHKDICTSQIPEPRIDENATFGCSHRNEARANRKHGEGPLVGPRTYAKVACIRMLKHTYATMGARYARRMQFFALIMFLYVIS